MADCNGPYGGSGTRVCSMKMDGYTNVLDAGELTSRRMKRVMVEGADIALFYDGGRMFAVQNDCPHQHFSMLHEGELKDCRITCPMHGWTFDLKTGRAVVGSGRLKRYAVEVADGRIWIGGRISEEG